MIKMKVYGFTLIELLIVVAIIAILAAIAIPNFLEARTRADVSRVVSDLRTIAMAEELYSTDNGKYHPCMGICSPWDNVRAAGPCEWFLYGSAGGDDTCYTSGPFLTHPIAYLTTIPIDPFMSNAYKKQYFQGDKSVLYRQAYNTTHNQFGLAHHIWVTDVGYSMRTPGPNLQIWTWDVEPVYDPTNGTVSNGDIWYVGKGRGFIGGNANVNRVGQ